jgi:hypothetical protein
MLIATKIYRPDTASVANWDVNLPQNDLRNWWQWAGPKADIVGRTLADKLPNHRALRAGEFTLVAKKRRGHILLEAYSQ